MLATNDGFSLSSLPVCRYAFFFIMFFIFLLCASWQRMLTRWLSYMCRVCMYDVCTPLCMSVSRCVVSRVSCVCVFAYTYIHTYIQRERWQERGGESERFNERGRERGRERERESVCVCGTPLPKPFERSVSVMCVSVCLCVCVDAGPVQLGRVSSQRGQPPGLPPGATQTQT